VEITGVEDAGGDWKVINTEIWDNVTLLTDSYR